LRPARKIFKNDFQPIFTITNTTDRPYSGNIASANLLMNLGAFFAASDSKTPQKTGLYACIFCPSSYNRAKGYRFNPLRTSVFRTTSLTGKSRGFISIVIPETCCASHVEPQKKIADRAIFTPQLRKQPNNRGFFCGIKREKSTDTTDHQYLD
jgi:hypothetical protein